MTMDIAIERFKMTKPIEPMKEYQNTHHFAQSQLGGPRIARLAGKLMFISLFCCVTKIINITKYLCYVHKGHLTMKKLEISSLQ